MSSECLTVSRADASQQFDEDFFRIVACLFSTAFLYAAGVLLSTYDVDDPDR